MIKLKHLIHIGKMTYNEGPTDKHKSRINYPITLFNDFVMEESPFPENASKETLDELKYLENKTIDKNFVEKHDDVTKVFKKLFKELELEFNKEEADELLRQSAKYLMELKYKYNRPRPYQIAEFYHMDVTNFNMDSMKTPSYPSGHATQGYLLGKIYSKRHTEYTKEFTDLGEAVAESRIVGKAHFPSDKEFGKKLAERLFDNLI
jgi:hypothetical protein|tara:strand:+ start:451 stop:1068 length:618 start_codon:yes stop_codon:yes gene_type:complete